MRRSKMLVDPPSQVESVTPVPQDLQLQLTAGQEVQQREPQHQGSKPHQTAQQLQLTIGQDVQQRPPQNQGNQHQHEAARPPRVARGGSRRHSAGRWTLDQHHLIQLLWKAG